MSCTRPSNKYCFRVFNNGILSGTFIKVVLLKEISKVQKIGKNKIKTLTRRFNKTITRQTDKNNVLMMINNLSMISHQCERESRKAQ